MTAVDKRGAPWSPAEVEQIESMMSEQIALTEIAVQLGRTEKAVETNSTDFIGSYTGLKLASACNVGPTALRSSLVEGPSSPSSEHWIILFHVQIATVEIAGIRQPLPITDHHRSGADPIYQTVGFK
jgi:hypothetical protein